MIDASLFLKIECLFGEEGRIKHEGIKIFNFFFNLETAKKLRDISVSCVSSWCHLDPCFGPSELALELRHTCIVGGTSFVPFWGVFLENVDFCSLSIGFACSVLLLSSDKAFHI